MLIDGMIVTRGLLIMSPWIEKILSGEKTWEMRGIPTDIRGPIALIKSGSGLILGTCNLVAVKGPLPMTEILSTDKHGIPQSEVENLLRNVLKYEKVYAWVLEEARPLRNPIPYDHPSGAVRWVDLADQEERTIVLTAGNIKNSHIYLRTLSDFFPRESIGGRNRSENAGHPLTLVVRGISGLIETDIASDKRIFRSRGWCRKFFEAHGLRAGDSIVIRKLDDYRYEIYPAAR